MYPLLCNAWFLGIHARLQIEMRAYQFEKVGKKSQHFLPLENAKLKAC
jgi:hypothetical protein